ncbi:MAG: NAD(P)H-hydrate dehydratase [Burkholderiales bacterium]|nr:NAD(P)H-hydrate dehydratase [Burkholderiales bacterium]
MKREDSGQPVYLTEDIRALERVAAARPGAASLMELAGLAAAEYARELLGENGRTVLVLAGPGNNGGDAFEVATHLKRWFYRVELVFAGDEHQLSEDALAALRKWRECGGNTYAAPPAALRPDLVVDGLFGIGLTRALEGGYAELINGINRLPGSKLALDIASGINADTGAVMGTALRATHTITFIALKPGLLTLDGPDHCGKLGGTPGDGLRVADLGLDVGALLKSKGATTSAQSLRQALAPRPRNFHKGNAGSVGVLGGAYGMVGAAVLAGRAALKLGAGKVLLGLLTDHPPYLDYSQPELMLRTPRELLEAGMITVFAVGPGMGTVKSAEQLLREVLDANVPLVLDADALNLIAASKTLQARLVKRDAAGVLTPHPAEAARLLGCTTAQVQTDRVKAAIELAQRYRAVAVLKGNGSIIADPDGTWLINTSGNPGMAAAGMGDVLTGMVASLLAQGADARAAAAAAVWLHGAAADALACAGKGPIGIGADEVIEEARMLLNKTIG